MIPIIFIIFIRVIDAGNIEITDLNINEGYLPIKIGEMKLINHYIKIIHIINTTELEVAKTQIKINMDLLKRTLPSDSINDNIYTTLSRNFHELESKLKTLMPRHRNKRGLINLLGKTLKVIAGTMDSEDEQEIFN